MTVIIKVDSLEGEESTWESELNEEEYKKLQPILELVNSLNGYIPEIDNEGIKLLKSCLPTPIHGFNKIIEIKIFNEVPTTLYL